MLVSCIPLDTPNKQQDELTRKACGCARYNTTLAARQDAYKAGTSLSGNDCVKTLPGLDKGQDIYCGTGVHPECHCLYHPQWEVFRLPLLH